MGPLKSCPDCRLGGKSEKTLCDFFRIPDFKVRKQYLVYSMFIQFVVLQNYDFLKKHVFQKNEHLDTVVFDVSDHFLTKKGGSYTLIPL